MRSAPDQLKQAVESQHGGTATLAQSVPVHETHEGKPVWDGTVHIFDLWGYPSGLAGPMPGPMSGMTASGGSLPSCTQGPINSPVKAVRAAIVAEARAK